MLSYIYQRRNSEKHFKRRHEKVIAAIAARSKFHNKLIFLRVKIYFDAN